MTAQSFSPLWSVCRSALQGLQSLLAPPACSACGPGLDARHVFCSSCHTTLIRSPHGDEMSFGLYGGALADAVGRFKYGKRPDLAQPLSHLLMYACANEPAPMAIVPVPLHPKRLRWRGFNQSALLAHRVASALDVPCVHALCRIAHGPSQTFCVGVQKRWKAVQHAFAPTPTAKTPPGIVWLVDDVRTSGATATACARVLLAQGARRVRLLVLATAGSRTFW